MNEKIKKFAPLAGLVLVLVLLMVYARKHATQGAGSDYMMTGGGQGDGGAAIAANAQLAGAQLQAQTQAYGALLDYTLGSEKIKSDASTALGLSSLENTRQAGENARQVTLAGLETARQFGLADRQVDLAKYEDAINRELAVDLQGREHLQRMAAIQYGYQIEQGRTNAQKSIAKHNIFANLGGNILKTVLGFL